MTQNSASPNEEEDVLYRVYGAEDGERPFDTLKLTPRVAKYGAGIYEAGDGEKCYTKLFVTDTGYVLPVNHRIISYEDLLDVYERGRLDGEAFCRHDTGGQTEDGG